MSSVYVKQVKNLRASPHTHLVIEPESELSSSEDSTFLVTFVFLLFVPDLRVRRVAAAIDISIRFSAFVCFSLFEAYSLYLRRRKKKKQMIFT